MTQRTRSGAAEQLLRTVIGLSLIGGAVLKLHAVAVGGLETTLLWKILDGSKAAIVGLSLVEAVLGSFVALKIGERVVGSVLIGMLAAFTVVLIVAAIQKRDTAIHCGCMGAFVRGPGGIPGFWYTIGHNVLLAAAIWVTTTWRPTRVRPRYR